MLLLLAVLVSAFAVDLPCANLQRLEQIQAFVKCQSDTALGSCGALGSLALGLPALGALQGRSKTLLALGPEGLAHELARAAHEVDRGARLLLDPKTRLEQLDVEVKSARAQDDIHGRYAKAIAADRKYFDPESGLPPGVPDEELAKRAGLQAEAETALRHNPTPTRQTYRARQALASAIKKNPSGPVYEPLIRAIPGDEMMVYDVANTAFEDLPERFRRPLEARAAEAAKLVKERLTDRMPLDPSFLDRVADKVAKNAANADGLTEDVVRQRVRQTLATALTRIEGSEVSALARGAAATLRTLSRFTPDSPLVAAKLLALPVTAGTMILDSDSTGCTSGYSVYVNETSGRPCPFAYQINENVRRFLSDAPERQRAVLMKYPEVCAFYKGLHAAFFARPRFSGLSCRAGANGSSVVSVKGEDERGAHVWDVDVRPDQSVRSVQVSEHGLPMHRLEFANAEGDLRHVTGGGYGWTLARLKLFVPQAVACCREGGATCATEFGGGGAPAAEPAPATAR